ncbi:MAG: AraC family transcriptional regulator [Pseudomonadota bacterium]
MIIPSPSFGLPEPIAFAATEGIFAAVTRPEVFDAKLDPARCILLVPLGSSAITISENGRGPVGEARRAYALTYLPSGVARNIRQTADVEMLYISITAHRAADILSTTGSKKWSLPPRLIEHQHGDIALLSQMLRRHLFEPTCPNAAFLTATTDLLLAHAIGSTRPSSQPDDAAAFTNGTLQRILSDIDERLEAGVRIGQLAKDLSLTPSAFTRKFRATVGCTPQRYVIERRIGRARELLRETDVPISEIAYAIGFSSQAHLTSSFKDLLGVTPGRYRQAYGNRELADKETG